MTRCPVVSTLAYPIHTRILPMPVIIAAAVMIRLAWVASGSLPAFPVLAIIRALAVRRVSAMIVALVTLQAGPAHIILARESTVAGVMALLVRAAPRAW